MQRYYTKFFLFKALLVGRLKIYMVFAFYVILISKTEFKILILQLLWNRQLLYFVRSC